MIAQNIEKLPKSIRKLIKKVLLKRSLSINHFICGMSISFRKKSPKIEINTYSENNVFPFSSCTMPDIESLIFRMVSSVIDALFCLCILYIERYILFIEPRNIPTTDTDRPTSMETELNMSFSSKLSIVFPSIAKHRMKDKASNNMALRSLIFAEEPYNFL